jgi:hypothetical protein
MGGGSWWDGGDSVTFRSFSAKASTRAFPSRLLSISSSMSTFTAGWPDFPEDAISVSRPSLMIAVADGAPCYTCLSACSLIPHSSHKQKRSDQDPAAVQLSNNTTPLAKAGKNAKTRFVAKCQNVRFGLRFVQLLVLKTCVLVCVFFSSGRPYT